jgi:Fe2+ or Zn2+ uptake regulation protein
MSERQATLANLLKSHGYSLTSPRRILFDLLAGQEPVSMRGLTEKAAGKMDRASVYRTIALFEQIGAVHRINIGWKYKIELSDAFAEHHHHLTCLKCKRVIPINARALETFIDNLAKSHDFQPVEHQIEVQGVCGDCQT